MANPKLPIVLTIVESYRIFFNNVGTYAKLIWIPFLLSLLAVSGFDYLNVLRGDTSLSSSFLIVVTASLFLLLAIGLITSVSAITAWHRLIILGKEHKDSRIRISIRKAEWGYLWRIFFILLLLFVIAYIFRFILVVLSIPIFGTGLVEGGTLASQSSYLIATTVALLPIAGYFLLLPAAAVNRPLKIGEVGQFWTGNMIRLWSVYVLAVAPETLLGMLLEAAEESSGTLMIAGVVNGYELLDWVNSFIFFTISIGVVSLAYRFLVEDHPITLTDPSKI